LTSVPELYPRLADGDPPELMVLVDWEDACEDRGGWKLPSQLNHSWRAVSVGYLIERTSEYLAIALTHSPTEGYFHGHLTIRNADVQKAAVIGTVEPVNNGQLAYSFGKGE